MNRIAIPIEKGKLSELFGKSSHYEIFEIDEWLIRKNYIEAPSLKDITELPEWFAKEGITDVITFKIAKQIINLFAKHKVNLFIGIKTNTSQEIIKDYINGRLFSDDSIISEITKE
ncbi:MAG: hypothetical protein ABFR05_05360 [Bacteroidota bacterium]